MVRAERLREVVALTGFTRIDSPDSGVDEDAEISTRAPLSRSAPTWVPAAEVRGEGIFLSLPEDRLAAWEDHVGVAERPEQLRLAHARWRARRGLADEGWRGHRYTLLHSLAHLLINELSMECGYSAASIRERIYSSEGTGDEAMAGILLYTAAPDSEGTLGGLVSLTEPSHVRPADSPGPGPGTTVRLRPAVRRPRPRPHRGLPAPRGLPRLPVHPRDQLRAREPLPRPGSGGTHPR